MHLGAIRAVAVAAMVFASALGPGVTGWCIDRGIGLDAQLVVMASYCVAAGFAMAFVSRRLRTRIETQPVYTESVQPSD